MRLSRRPGPASDVCRYRHFLWLPCNSVTAIHPTRSRTGPRPPNMSAVEWISGLGLGYIFL